MTITALNANAAFAAPTSIALPPRRIVGPSSTPRGRLIAGLPRREHPFPYRALNHHILGSTEIPVCDARHICEVRKSHLSQAKSCLPWILSTVGHWYRVP